MQTNHDVLNDFIDHFMSEGTKERAINQINNTMPGGIIFTTYASYSNIIEIYEALLELNDVKYSKKLEGRLVRFIKLS